MLITCGDKEEKIQQYIYDLILDIFESKKNDNYVIKYMIEETKFYHEFSKENIEIYNIYDFEKLRKKFKGKSGVYFFIHTIGSNDYLKYIGKSKNLYQRLNLKEHHIAKKNIDYIDKIAIIEIDSNYKIPVRHKLYPEECNFAGPNMIKCIERAGIKKLKKVCSTWNTYDY